MLDLLTQLYVSQQFEHAAAHLFVERRSLANLSINPVICQDAPLHPGLMRHGAGKT